MSREIELTQGRIAVVDDELFEELDRVLWFAKKKKYGWFAMRHVRTESKEKTKSGRKNKSGRAQVYMHQFILRTDKTVAHMNSNTLDNRTSNLREASRAEQTYHTKKRHKTSSKYKGVSWCVPRKLWIAQIQHRGKNHYLGGFACEEDAAEAYDRAAVAYFGTFTVLNFPRKETERRDL